MYPIKNELVNINILGLLAFPLIFVIYHTKTAEGMPYLEKNPAHFP
jgi:hypothetical protein